LVSWFSCLCICKDSLSFTEIQDIHIPVAMNGKLLWADFDNDSLLDVFITGVSGPDTLMAVYKNNGKQFFFRSCNI